MARASVIYLAGPMTGFLEENKPAFEQAAAKLRSEGHAVITPHEISEPLLFLREWISEKRFYAICLAVDKEVLAGVDAIYMLPGWEGSKGSGIEFTYATEQGIPVYAYTTRERITAFQPPAPAVDPSVAAAATLIGSFNPSRATV